MSPIYACRVFILYNPKGFLDETLEPDDASIAIEEVYTVCKVLPASKLQMNQTGIDNGDITSFSATFAVGGGGGGVQWPMSRLSVV